nr:zinc dependent phospholipase C family protein [uncultured Olsenella sp.]
MPALITHHLFGEEAAALLPQGILADEQDLLAFLLGNQGPDPLFARFSTLPRTAATCHRLGSLMHGQKVLDAFLALRDAVSHLREDDKTCGRAFALGMLSHYALDSGSHAFVYAQQAAIIAAADGLGDAQSEVHSLIETDIDSWLLWELRRQTVVQAPPADMLARTERIDRVAGALLSQLAWQVYGVSLDAEEYAGCTHDYELLYRAIEPVGSPRGRALMAVERLVRPHSKLASLAHPVWEGGDCPAANLDRHEWADPSTGERRFESFPDLFYAALDAWPDLAEAFVTRDVEALRELAGRVDYDGRPQEA